MVKQVAVHLVMAALTSLAALPVSAAQPLLVPYSPGLAASPEDHAQSGRVPGGGVEAPHPDAHPGELPGPAQDVQAPGPRSSPSSVPVGGDDIIGWVALISDQSELEAITPILDDTGFGYSTYNNNWNGTQGIYTSDYDFLSIHSTVVWYASGYSDGRLITPEEHDALEQYLQAGGRLLVTGYDTLCSPDDPLLADLVRSSHSGGDSMGDDYTITNGTHPITLGPYGTFPYLTALEALNSDHDWAEADTARGATTVAELASGWDKIIATELPSGGIVVYWNGNNNASDWTDVPSSAAGNERAGVAESKQDMEGGHTGIVSFDESRPPANDAIPPGSEVEEGHPVSTVPREASPGLQPALIPEVYEGTLFPATGDTVWTHIPTTWRIEGDYAEGTRALGLSSITGVDYYLSSPNNTLEGSRHADLQLSINGNPVGSFSVYRDEDFKWVSFWFPAISGPVYTIRLEQTNTIEPGKGAIRIPLDTSVLVFYDSSKPQHVAMLKNAIHWLQWSRLRDLPYLTEFDGVGPWYGWSADGLWHQVRYGSPYPNYHSPNKSWWYGQDTTGDYDTGAANIGILTSPSIWIPPGVPAELSFWQWYETEPAWLPQSVYFDRYHDIDGDDNISGGIYTDWANRLVTNGWTVDEYNQEISLATLGGYQVLALFDPEIALTAGELAAVNDFLQAGGRAVLLGEVYNTQFVNTRLNDLSAAHGITFNSDMVQDSTDNDGDGTYPLIKDFAKLPPLWEVGTVALYGACSLTVSGSAERLATGDDDASAAALPAGADGTTGEERRGTEGLVGPQHVVPGAPLVMARAAVGQGEIIAIGDSTLWDSSDLDGDGPPALLEYGNAVLSDRAFGKAVHNPNWDKMWVQVSAGGAPFVNLLQVQGGPMATWQPRTVDLTPYAGNVVRVGFRFDTLDHVSNGYRGWYIDDVGLSGPKVFLPLVLRDK